MGGSDALSGCASGAGGESMEPWAPRAVIPVPRHGNPCPFPHGSPTAIPSPRHPSTAAVWPPPHLAPSFPCPDTGIQPLPARTDNAPISLPCLLKAKHPALAPRPVGPSQNVAECRTFPYPHSENVAAPTTAVWPPPHLAPSFPCPDTGIQTAPSRTDRPLSQHRRRHPRSGRPRPPPEASAPHGPVGEAPAPHNATSAPPSNAPISLPCLLKDPRNTRRWRPGPSARFTSKCRKMSPENVALFHTPTRRMSLLRVKNLTFLAKTRPFWPIPVHFAPVRPPPPRGGGLRRGNFVQRFPSALGGASPPTPGPLPLRAGGTRRGAV